MNLSWQEAAAFLEARDGFLILTHKRPDGDTIGCAVALCLGLRRLGKTAWVLTNPDATDLFDPYWGDTRAPADFVPETVVTVDVASEGLFFSTAACWKGRVDLAIDHHPSNEGFAARTCLEGDKAACGEIIFKLLTGWFPLDQALALPLYLAVSTDTGCFQYRNTSPNTHRVAAELMETGIDAAQVNLRHFRSKSRVRLLIEGRMVERAHILDGGTLAIASFSLADRAEFGATDSDLEDLAGFIGQLKGVRTSVTITEVRPGECKISVRTGPELDASAVCARLGGGGHRAAAGCTAKGSVEEAKAQILASIRAQQSGE